MRLAGRAFGKLEALGNDFVVVEIAAGEALPNAATIMQLADRRRGIGFDQLLLLSPAGREHVAGVRIFNADGSEAEQCGNGMRAVAAWLDRHERLGDAAVLQTPAGPVTIARGRAGDYRAELPGPACIEPAALALNAPSIPDGVVDWRLVSVGNPHLLIETETTPDPVQLGRTVDQVHADPGWRNRVNIGLVRRREAGTVELCVHERGAGPTPACGSAAVAAALLSGGTGEVAVDQPGGRLVIDLNASPGRAVTRGPARVVFEGRMA